MRHTFWYIDEIMILIGNINVPKRIESESDKQKAIVLLDKI